MVTRVGAGAAAAVVVAGMVVLGTGHPSQGIRLTSGAAWLASAKVGQVTLLDGSTVEVAGQVPVAAVGNVIDVVQQGTSAYVVDKTANTIRRVDGATFTPTPPATPIPQVTGGLVAFAGANSLYAMDTQHGIVTEADPRTGAPIGEPHPMSAQLSANTAVVDDANRLWIIDTATGDLTRIAGDRRTKQAVTSAGKAVMTLVDGSPVVVSTAQRKAVVVSPDTGIARSTIDLDLRPDDAVEVGGSPHGSRLYVVASRGVVNVCDLRASNCDTGIPLDSSKDLGGPVEAGNRLFVPDYGNGRVWIIDLTGRRVVGQAQVLAAAGKFQLLNRDGVVFFNNPDTEQAGVIHLDGRVVNAAKYDPRDPNKGLVTPRNTSQTPSTTSSPSESPTTPPPTSPPTPSPSSSFPSSSQTPTTGSTPGESPLSVRIRVSKETPMVSEDIALSVDAGGIPPATVEWSYGDGGTANGLPVTHRWTSAGTYLVTAQATMPDGRHGTASLNVTVSAVPKYRLTVTTNAGGTVTSSDGSINCAPTSTCHHDYDQGTHVTLTPHANTDYAFSEWAKDCADHTCDLTMDSGKTAEAHFKPTVAKLTVQIAAAGGSVKLNGQGCNSCTMPFGVGASVSVAATPDSDHDFDSWDAATCADVHALSCTTQANTTRTIVARFKAKPKYTLTVQLYGPGAGQVRVDSARSGSKVCAPTSSPCATQWIVGEQLTLTADSSGGGFFLRWEGDCGASASNVCHLTMTGPMTATAYYDILH